MKVFLYRDLNFVTSRGRLSVSMKLYSRRDYHPNSRLGSRPSVLVGEYKKAIKGDDRVATICRYSLAVFHFYKHIGNSADQQELLEVS